MFKLIINLPSSIYNKLSELLFNYKIINSVLKELRLQDNRFQLVTIKHTCNSFIIFGISYCYKFSKNSFWDAEQEFVKLKTIKTLHPNLEVFLPELSLVKLNKENCLKCDLYNNVTLNEIWNHSVILINSFKSNNIIVNKSLLFSSEVLEGLAILNKLFKIDVDILLIYLKDSDYFNDTTLGFCHGDFHPGNIMIDLDSNYRIIDLDCIYDNGIQFFDVFYFLVEFEYLTNKIHWLKTIGMLLSDELPSHFDSYLDKCNIKFNVGKVILFFLHRIGQESLKFRSYYSYNELKYCSEKINKIIYDRVY